MWGKKARSVFRSSTRMRQRGQTTAEYALVIAAAATIAGLLIAWATKSGAIGDLFDAVMRRVSDVAQ